MNGANGRLSRPSKHLCQWGCDSEVKFKGAGIERGASPNFAALQSTLKYAEDRDQHRSGRYHQAACGRDRQCCEPDAFRRRRGGRRYPQSRRSRTSGRVQRARRLCNRPRQSDESVPNPTCQMGHPHGRPNLWRRERARGRPACKLLHREPATRSQTRLQKHRFSVDFYRCVWLSNRECQPDRPYCDTRFCGYESRFS
jgi:hypothetical protein